MLKELLTPNLDELELNFRKKLPESVLVHSMTVLDLKQFTRPINRYFIPEDEDETTAECVVLIHKYLSFDDAPHVMIYVRSGSNDVEKLRLHLDDFMGKFNLPVVMWTPTYWKVPTISLMSKHGELNLEEDYIVLVLLRETDLLAVPPMDKNVSVQPLTEKNVQDILDHWKYTEANSEAWISEKVRLGLSYGTFFEDRLVSWTCTNQFGGIGLLHTKEEYRRRGYAKICIAALARHLLSSFGILPASLIDQDNVASIKLFSELGFKRSGDLSLLTYAAQKDVSA